MSQGLYDMSRGLRNMSRGLYDMSQGLRDMSQSSRDTPYGLPDVSSRITDGFTLKQYMCCELRFSAPAGSRVLCAGSDALLLSGCEPAVFRHCGEYEHAAETAQGRLRGELTDGLIFNKCMFYGS
jgi:hypothetical protein